MTPTQYEWLAQTILAARTADHIFHELAACEAALESAWGSSALAREGNNLFGMKQHQHPIYGNLALPTREYLDGAWTVVSAQWVKYPTQADCFADRMDTLERLQAKYPHYAAALAATDAVTYIVEVSATWSTDPERAAKVQSIYHSYLSYITAAPVNLEEA